MAERIGLTTGEAAWLARRRNDETQADLAARLGVSIDRVADAERDRAEPVWRDRRALRRRLSAGEFLALVRRRKKWSAARAARWAGVSRLTYLKAEADRTGSAARFASRWARGGIPDPRREPVVRIGGPRL